MSEADSQSIRVEQLRRRWESEPSTQVALQLAEEYRSMERPEEGIEVLEKAVREAPNHLSAQVALGRFLLELGRHQRAEPVLEGVVERDPTHLIANKLLVRLYAETGRRQKAQDRLDLYVLLNEGDSDIARLSRLVEASAVAAEPAAGTPETQPSPAAEALAAADPFPELLEGVGGPAFWAGFGAEGIFLPAAGPRRPGFDSPPDDPSTALTGAPAAAEGATLTLAGLYLRQGHLEEAERSFREILRREPESTGALRGLNEIRVRRGEPLSAAHLLAGLDADPAAPREGRRAVLLRRYLELLAGGARRN